MDFKNSHLILVSILSTVLFSCVGPNTSIDDENLIGSKLENISSLKTSAGNDSAAVVLFDPLLQKIHQFNLDQMSVTRTLDVLNSDVPHYVLHDPAGNYIIDLSLKHISIFDQNSNVIHNPIQFFGKPISAAFRPELGLLVMYDDLRTAGVVQLSTSGSIQKSAVFGSIVSSDNSIVAGDLLENGKLVLALSDNSIAEVDLEQSLVQNRWVSQTQLSGLTEISWLAPVPAFPNLVFIKSKEQVTLFDLNLKIAVSTLTLTGEIEKYSKSFHPHLLERTDSRTLKLIYTDGLSIKTRVIPRGYSSIIHSDLNLDHDIWSFVEIKSFRLDLRTNNSNFYKYDRQIVRYRVSDLAALQSKSIPDRAEVKLAKEYFFCLFPSDLGYATKNSVLTDRVDVIKNFNLKKF